jgi:hypothetical protein
MFPRLAFAVFTGLVLIGTGAFAACPPEPVKPHHAPSKTKPQANNCFDLNGVPEISAHVVAAEPATAIPKAPGYVPPEPTKYEGPTLGMTKPDPGVRPAPTVGYHWSLE